MVVYAGFNILWCFKFILLSFTWFDVIKVDMFMNLVYCQTTHS